MGLALAVTSVRGGLRLPVIWPFALHAYHVLLFCVTVSHFIEVALAGSVRLLEAASGDW